MGRVSLVAEATSPLPAIASADIAGGTRVVDDDVAVATT
jgi:hypothetical protein